MRRPTPQELVDTCAEGGTPLERSVRLARLGWPDAPLDDDTPGERNRRVLAVRRALLGPFAPCVVDCATCGARLDVELDVAGLLDDAPPVSRAPLRVESGAEVLAMRVPTMVDVAAACAAASGNAAAVLAARCVLDGAWPSAPSPALLSAVAQAFDRTDPHGALTVEMCCPECGADVRGDIDPVALVWDELGRHVESLLDDVHVLASAYGWSEPAILALPTSRRRRYLERVLA